MQKQTSPSAAKRPDQVGRKGGTKALLDFKSSLFPCVFPLAARPFSKQSRLAARLCLPRLREALCTSELVELCELSPNILRTLPSDHRTHAALTHRPRHPLAREAAAGAEGGCRSPHHHRHPPAPSKSYRRCCFRRPPPLTLPPPIAWPLASARSSSSSVA